MTLSVTGKQLCRALEDAFRNWEGLEMLVAFHLDENLESIVARTHPLRYVVFQLVQWAESRGELDKLIEAALEDNPSNELLIGIARNQRAPEGAEKIEVIQTSLVLDADTALVEAYRSVASHFSESLIGEQRLVIRRRVRDIIENFLDAPTRFGVVIGEIGTGKSTALAVETRHLMERGWTVLPLKANEHHHSIDAFAEVTGVPLTLQGLSSAFRRIVEPWLRSPVAGSAGLILIIDQVEAAPDPSAGLLSAIEVAVGNEARDRIKVLLCCRTVAWENRVKNLLFADERAETSLPRAIDHQIITISDFTDGELDQALAEIGADDLISSHGTGLRVDIHIASLRSLLKRPEKFRQYAELLRQGNSPLARNLTWSRLTAIYFERDVQKVAECYRLDAATLRQTLMELAELGWQQQAQEFRLDLADVREHIPSLFVALEEGNTVCSALIESGVLSRHHGVEEASQIAFQSADVGNYLLSLLLERRIEGLTLEEVRERVSSWIEQSWNYSHLLDAILAWVDHLSDGCESEMLRTLIDELLETPSHTSLFHLVDPRVIGTLFAAIRATGEESFNKYREAALALRPSPEAMESIRNALSDPNPLLRRLAAELVGIHHDYNSVPALISLLEDENDEVRVNASRTFGWMGNAPIPFLLEALRSTRNPEEVRGRYLNALRTIGFRDESVSEVLGESLRDALRGGAEYLKSGLLAAAHLRDRFQIPYAIVSLTHHDWEVAHAAAKLLTEVPHPAAFAPLLLALTPTVGEVSEVITRYFLPRQLLAALAATDKDAAAPAFSEQLRQTLSGAGEIHFSDVMRIAEKFDVAAPYGVLLKELAQQLGEGGRGVALWRASEILGETWRRGPLETLNVAENELSAEGVDIARLLVDAVAPNIQEHGEFPLGDRLNRVKDLLPAVKCRAANLAPEACRLLETASELSTNELCRLLWLLGDTRAEELLIRKFGALTDEGGRGWHARSAVIRALGTCGAERGTRIVLSYLRGEQNISLYFYEETLYPLLWREMVTPRELEEIARDAEASVGGRVACALALAEADAPRHRNLFVALSGDDEHPLVQSYAVNLLASTADRSMVPRLRRLLTQSLRPAIRSSAAVALGTLGAREALDEIRAAFEREGRIGYLSALAHFQDAPSLPLLLEKMERARRDERRGYYDALSSFARVAGGREALRESLDTLLSDEPDYFDYQSALFAGLAEHDPDLLLDTCLAGNVWGRISQSGREALARSIGFLWRQGIADRQLVFDAAARLVCDKDVRVRETALLDLDFLDVDFSLRLYETLMNGPAADEWSRACAVRSLSYWESERSLISKARYASELLVRSAAEFALEIRYKREEIRFHVGQLAAGDGPARLCAYFCLRDHGDLGTGRQLRRTVPKQSLQRAFVNNLSRAVHDRLRNDYRKRQDAEDKFLETRGIVYFE